MRKSFVLDTNVLLHNPAALTAFADNEVVIPIQVIEELDQFKKGNDDLARNALSQETLLEIDGPCMGQKEMRRCGWSSSPAQGTRPSAPGPASTSYARFRCWTIGDAGGPGFSGKEEAGL
jgi:hypothetical protein